MNKYATFACLQPDHLPKHEDIDGAHFIITRVLIPISAGQSVSIQSISTKIAFFYRPGLLITVHRLPQAFMDEVKEKLIERGDFKRVESIVAKMLWHILHSYETPAVRW
ncbi:CorA family divalent cation transporter [Aquirufa regiilacus]